jgi:DNA-binding beta-propeller fold protein YncE
MLIYFNTFTYGQYLSPTRIAVHPATGKMFVLLSTAQSIAKVDPVTEQLLETFKLNFTPSGICFASDGSFLYITENSANGKVHIVSALTGKTTKTIAVGAYPSTVCINKQGTQLWVANRFSNDISLIDLRKQKEVKRLPVLREPKSLALSPDEKLLAVGNYLPYQSSLDERVSAQITFIDANSSEILCHIPLPDGSQSVEDVCFSKDGDFVYATHLQSRYHFPATQLERGWMNTNALTVIETIRIKHYATMLLDDIFRGAANPCGMTLSESGDRLYIAVSGTHELMALDLSALTKKFAHTKPVELPSLSNDLIFLNETKTRVPLYGKGARYVATLHGKIFVSDYFSGSLSVVDEDKLKDVRFIKLGNEPEPNDIRKGELYFADAMICFQNWQSCVSCHPDVRADGLNWDLINDGIGNPKNTKSLLYSHVTPPCMITGIRATAEIAVRAGIRLIQFSERPEEDAACMDQYLRSIQPVPSPYLLNGKLSKTAQKGKQIFERAGCADCHNGKYLTDGKKYDVGTGIDEYTNFPFDTPTLKEIWRTAPYLYNGSAKTIKEVLTIFNKNDKHGITSKLKEEEIIALEEYILSL